MNVNAGHERTSKARIIHQIQLIRGITDVTCARGILHYGNNYYLQITSDPLLAILFQ
ncbi:hypothetical protein [Shigella dysenteriae]|nr:hypothetical protein [Shigella dysenteriae]AHA68387.1 Transposase [Shigella dysenteriae 1617]WNT52492.1 hypothetical protein PWP84_10775 [Shigella dysenteriae]